MSKYLDAAAALVKKAADDNEQRWGSTPGAAESGRVEFAKLYALLAAVDKGLMPEAVAEEIYGQLNR
ncbi:hypothetical protein [Glycomyces tarimensis]